MLSGCVNISVCSDLCCFFHIAMHGLCHVLFFLLLHTGLNVISASLYHGLCTLIDMSWPNWFNACVTLVHTWFFLCFMIHCLFNVSVHVCQVWVMVALPFVLTHWPDHLLLVHVHSCNGICWTCIEFQTSSQAVFLCIHGTKKNISPKPQPLPLPTTLFPWMQTTIWPGKVGLLWSKTHWAMQSSLLLLLLWHRGATLMHLTPSY